MNRDPHIFDLHNDIPQRPSRMIRYIDKDIIDGFFFNVFYHIIKICNHRNSPDDFTVLLRINNGYSPYRTVPLIFFLKPD